MDTAIKFVKPQQNVHVFCKVIPIGHDRAEIQHRIYDFGMHSGREAFGKFMSWTQAESIDCLVTRSIIPDFNSDRRVMYLAPYNAHL